MKPAHLRKNSDNASGARERLLAIAGELFAKHGRDGLSVRQITAAADVNLAAVNYHFGSKDGLFHAVCLEQIHAMNQERLELLEAVEKTTGPSGPNVEQVLEAYMRPMVHLLRSPDPSSLLMTRMIMNEFRDMQSLLPKLMRDEVQPFLQRFAEALQRSLNTDDMELVVWGLTFNTGVMLHTTICADKITSFYPGVCECSDPEKILRHMVEHGAAGMRALVRPEKK